jgi:hypothetical protein
MRALYIDPATVSIAKSNAVFHNKRGFLEHIKEEYEGTEERSMEREASAVRRGMRFRRGVRAAVGNSFVQWGMKVKGEAGEYFGNDVQRFFDSVRKKLTHRLEKALAVNDGFAVRAYTTVMIQRGEEDVDEYGQRSVTYDGAVLPVSTTARPIRNSSEVNMFIDDQMNHNLAKADQYLMQSFAVRSLTLNIQRYQPVAGSTYNGPLPSFIASKGCCINVKNEDDVKCGLWSILAHMHPGKDAQRVSKYRQYESEINIGGVEFPLKVADVPRLERLNNLSISVFTYNQGKSKSTEFSNARIGTAYISDRTCERFGNIKLLLYEGHYSLIKSWKKFTNKKGGHMHICDRCCTKSCKTQAHIDAHMQLCKQSAGVRVKMPKSGSVMEFKSFEKSNRYPIAIYGDFESIQPRRRTRCRRNPQSHTRIVANHVAASWQIKIVCTSKSLPADFPTEYSYRGQKAAEKFVEQLKAIQWTLIDRGFGKEKMTPLTTEQWRSFNRCKACPQCKTVFDLSKKPKKVGLRRVRDHDHNTGEFRGALCSTCNINTGRAEVHKKNRFIPMFFHNLKGYDSHLIMQAIVKLKGPKDRVTCIAQNSEKYISFTMNKYRFLDSAAFQPSSLSSLLKVLPDEKKHLLRAEFGEDMDLLSEKGHFPYEWFDRLNKLKNKRLPPIECWNDTLNDRKMKPADYEVVKRIWARRQMQSFGDWHDMYLKIDVLGLADVFEHYRDTTMEAYGLDPVHYYTAPGLFKDAMLKLTGAKPELMTDQDMYTMCEAGIRGGMSVVSHRYAKANNKYLRDYDVTKPSSYLQYYDQNALYAGVMTGKLPYKDYKMMDVGPLNHEEVARLNKQVMELSDCIVEVDVAACPRHLHDAHNQYPFLPEHMVVEHGELSQWQRDCMERTKGKFFRCKKLMGTLRAKEHYVVHIDTLKYAMMNGLQVTKVHRGISFESKAWMKPYIDFNTMMRKRCADAGDDAGVQYFKDASNAIFGKMMEGVRNRTNVKLVSGGAQLRLEGAKPHFHRVLDKMVHRGEEVDDFTVGVQLGVQTVRLDKPIAVGMAILDLSKVRMQRFHYGYMLPKYGAENTDLLGTDTDSLTYHVRTADLYKDQAENAEYFDTSNYPYGPQLPNSDAPDITRFFDARNKKVPGKMKDECGGLGVMTRWIGLRSKCNSYEVQCGEGKVPAAHNTLKGINRSVVKQQIITDDYVKALFQGTVLRVDCPRIRSVGHQLQTIVQNKKALSAYDDKRFICDNGITTLAYGHHRALPPQVLAC